MLKVYKKYRFFERENRIDNIIIVGILIVINKGRAPPSVIDDVGGIIIDKKARLATSIQRKPNMAIDTKKNGNSLSLFRDDKVDKISIFLFFILFY